MNLFYRCTCGGELWLRDARTDFHGKPEEWARDQISEWQGLHGRCTIALQTRVTQVLEDQDA